MERSVLRRRSLERSGQALPHHIEGFDLCPNWRNGRSRHNLASRAIGRRVELGLPVLLAARRHLHAARLHAAWILRRSARVARPAVRSRSRSCTGWAENAGFPSSPCRGSRAMRIPRRRELETRRTSSCNSMYWARLRTRCSRRSSRACSPLNEAGPCGAPVLDHHERVRD